MSDSNQVTSTQNNNNGIPTCNDDVKEVHVDGLVVLQIIQQCESTLPALSKGCLLGLGENNIVEVTHSFGTPIYATAEEEQQARDSGELYGIYYSAWSNPKDNNPGVSATEWVEKANDTNVPWAGIDNADLAQELSIKYFEQKGSFSNPPCTSLLSGSIRETDPDFENSVGCLIFL